MPAVAPLVCLLADSASRNQSNAAGALGNLSRHADTVVPAILRAGAVQVCGGAHLSEFYCNCMSVHLSHHAKPVVPAILHASAVQVCDNMCNA